MSHRIGPLYIDCILAHTHPPTHTVIECMQRHNATLNTHARLFPMGKVFLFGNTLSNYLNLALSCTCIMSLLSAFQLIRVCDMLALTLVCICTYVYVPVIASIYSIEQLVTCIFLSTTCTQYICTHMSALLYIHVVLHLVVKTICY